MTSTVGPGGGFIRTVRGDLAQVPSGVVYAHEHLIIDSPLIEAKFPQIHLYDVDSAVEEMTLSRDAGVALVVDAMPVSAGRDVSRLGTISERSGVAIVAATGLHHDRYYGPLHWSNRVGVDELVGLFIADLVDGIDAFDYTGPIVCRTDSKAGIVKVATSGPSLDARDRRNLEAAGTASVSTGAPVLTHCEGGFGGLEQVEFLGRVGVPAGSVILSHVDKTEELGYLRDLAATGAYLELDQTLRQSDRGIDSISIRAITALVEGGYGGQLVVGTDGARRSLWSALGGKPGLAWLAAEFGTLLAEAGHSAEQISAVMRDNALDALRWRALDS